MMMNIECQEGKGDALEGIKLIDWVIGGREHLMRCRLGLYRDRVPEMISGIRQPGQYLGQGSLFSDFIVTKETRLGGVVCEICINQRRGQARVISAK